MAAATMAAKPSFVFMCYTNPTEDSKRLENRQKVAKFAMLGRKKDGPATTTSTNASNNIHRASTSSASSTTSSSSTNTALPLSDTAATDREWPAIQQPWDTAAAFASPTHRSASRSSNSTSSSLRSSFAYSAPSPHTSPSDGWPSPQELTLTQVRSRHDSPLDNATAPVPFGSLGSTTELYTTDPVQEEQHIRQPAPAISAARAKKSVKKRAAGRRTDSTKAPSSSGTSETLDAAKSTAVARLESGPNDFICARQAGPRNLLNANAADPFDALPIKANAHTWELLYQYMNARLISSVYANGSPDTYERIKRMRHTVWGPLTMKSKASLNALVAYVESTPGLPNRSRSQDFLFSHVQAAMQGIREALSRPNVATDDSICFAVVLLMLTAQRTGNTSIYAKHAAGLATLLSARTEALRSSGEEDDNTVRQLRSFCVSDPRDQCLYCRESKEVAAASPSFPTDMSPTEQLQSFDEATLPRGQGFRELIQRGVLTQGMSAFLEPAMIWSTLAERARRDKLSAAIGATHAWIDEGEFTLKGSIHYLDTATHTAMRLCFYLSSWLDWQHSCSAVRRLAKAIFLTIRQADIDSLIVQCPDLLHWLALMAGPLSEGEVRVWFSQLLVRAGDAQCLTVWDFHSTIESYTYRFVWSGTMTAGAERFWEEAYYCPSSVPCYQTL